MLGAILSAVGIALASVVAATLAGMTFASDAFNTVGQNISSVRESIENTINEPRFAIENTANQALDAKLIQAVADGTLTQQQAAEIAEKYLSIRADIEAMKQLPEAQQAALLAEIRAGLDQWAASNNIDPVWITLALSQV